MSMLAIRSRIQRKVLIVFATATIGFVATHEHVVGRDSTCPPQWTLEIGGDYDGACVCIVNGRDSNTLSADGAWQLHEDGRESCPGGLGGTRQGPVHTPQPDPSNFNTSPNIYRSSSTLNPAPYGASSSSSGSGSVQ